MSKIIDRFGRTVESRICKNPALTHRLLCAGYSFTRMQMKHFPNRKLPDSRADAAVICMDALLDPLKKRGQTAIVNIFLPCEMLHALGIRPLVAEQISCYLCGAASEQGFLKTASAAGVPDTMCSYHRIMTGFALSGVMPKPDFAANTTMACDANTNTFRFLSRHWKVPHFTIDTPMSCSDEAVDYVASQLEKMGRDIEDTVKMKIDREKLTQSLSLSRKTLENYNKYLKVLAEKYFINDMTSEMYSILALHNLLGTPQSENYFRMLLKDCREAPERGKGRRLFWVHTLPNCQDSMREIINWNPDNQLLISDLTIDAPDDFRWAGETDPYRAMARRVLGNTFNGEFSHRGRKIIAAAHKLNADGIVMFSHWGCRNTNGGIKILSDMAEEAGIPLLVLDGDGCDMKNTNDGQMSTRLEAFLELLEEKK